MASLLVKKASQEYIGKKYFLDEDIPIVLIGKATATSKPDITFEDDYISRCHAQITCERNTYSLCDIGSTNGTELNGQIIEPYIPYKLDHNATIGLSIVEGKARIVLEFKDDRTVVATLKEGATLPRSNEELNEANWLSFNANKVDITVDSKIVALTPKEYQVLHLTYKKQNEVCTRDELILAVWGSDAISEASLDQIVKRLREKIEPDPSNPTRLITRKGFGFILIV